MRKPSASTKPSRKSPTSDLADPRQDFLAEQFDAAHQRVDSGGAGRMQRQIEPPGAALLAAALDLRDDRARPADEGGRQHAADIGGPRLAGDIALVGFQQ